MGGENDMFFDECEDYDIQDLNYCNYTFGSRGFLESMYRPEAATHHYGMNFAAASNIVFT